MLGILYRVIAAYLIRQAGHTQQSARAGAVTLIQRFGSALNLNIHFHTHYDKAKHLMATFGAACLEAVEASETGQGGAGAALSTA